MEVFKRDLPSTSGVKSPHIEVYDSSRSDIIEEGEASWSYDFSSEDQLCGKLLCPRVLICCFTRFRSTMILEEATASHSGSDV
ncbi:hypothetical protein GDO78_013576 [Eleutherodactylus coqui]|uniref:Uncharacterized protein n=1 Tax=Eleutherodactylus coqui TaxID=57060 RepID=A0A8J6EQS9_ELECQ|nr:hypothetical protein GDO78_013576 [Eleutherodactylus coqui]